MLGGKVHESLAHGRKARKEEEEEEDVPKDAYNTIAVSSTLCLHLAVVVALMQIFHKRSTILVVRVISYERISSSSLDNLL